VVNAAAGRSVGMEIFKPKDRVELLGGWLIHDRKEWKKV
jgi:hypothetical protein